MRWRKFKNIILVCIAMAILAGTFFFHYFFHITIVEGVSMENTLSNGDYIVINKQAYTLKSPQRFDIVVFPYDEEEEIFYIKRIIGLPGETIQIINSGIYIDGKRLYEDYGKESIDEYAEGIANDKIRLKEDEYFVLGDNRNNSIDSRDISIGAISRDKIFGKAELCLLPLSSFRVLRG